VSPTSPPPRRRRPAGAGSWCRSRAPRRASRVVLGRRHARAPRPPLGQLRQGLVAERVDAGARRPGCAPRARAGTSPGSGMPPCDGTLSSTSSASRRPT
jgi:hypothetical protein